MADTIVAEAPAPAAPAAVDPVAQTAWFDALPDDLKSVPFVQEFKTAGKPLAEVVKRAVNADKLVGAKGIIRPGKDAPKEAWEKFYNELGRPETPDKYELPKEGIPQGVEFNQELTKQFALKAHELGLNGQQFAGLARVAAEVAAKQKEGASAARQQAQQQAIGTLKGEWGQAFDQNIALAKDAVKRLGGDELVAYMNESGLGDDPRMVKFAAKVGKMIASDEIIGSGSNRSFKHSPDEAKREADRLMANGDFRKSYFGDNDPGHEAAVRQYEALMAAAYVSA